MVTSAASWGVLVAIAAAMVATAAHPRWRRGYGLVLSLGHRHVGYGLLSAAGTAAAAWLLLQLPGAGWSWWGLMGGAGNPALGQSATVAASTEAVPVRDVVPVTMLVLFALTAPALALVEEAVFRLGCESWSRSRTVAAVAGFGLLHAAAGVPAGAAAALGVLAFVTTWRYRATYVSVAPASPDPHAEPDGGLHDEGARCARASRSAAARGEALRESTLVHLVHNWAFAIAAGGWLLLGAA